MPGVGQVVLRGRAHSRRSNTLRWALKAFPRLTLHTLSRLYLEIYVYIHIYMQEYLINEESKEEHIERFGGRKGKKK